MVSQKGSNKTEAAETPAAAPTAAQAAQVARRAERLSALAQAATALAGDSNDAEHDALVAMIDAFTPRTAPSAGPRVLLEKADPAAVAEFFLGTGLTRKELAAAAGVSPSVIATVQNPKGDRWSTKTFAEKQKAIAAWATEHKAEIDARKANEAAEDAARKSAADAKAARAVARQKAADDRAAAAKAKAAAPTAAAPKAKASGNGNGKGKAAAAAKPAKAKASAPVQVQA